MTGFGEESSQEQYQQIKASELYPKKHLQADDSNIQVPFPELCGESAEYLGKTTDGVISLSNYRLFVRFKDSFVNVPLGLIESVEYRDIFFIYVCCKDAHSFRCTFSTNEVCLEWYKRLCMAITPPAKVNDVFAFPFNAYLRDHIGEGKEIAHPLSKMVIEAPELRVDEVPSIEQATARPKWYSFDWEVERMGLIDRKNQVWKITHINQDFKMCASYPKLHIVPKSVSDSEIEAVAGFRASRRFPSVVWRDRKSGAVIARCSQPEVGWLGWRNNQDEALIEAIASACMESVPMAPCPDTVTNRKMLILDARSYAAAVANRAKGGGCECIDYYPNCEIQFMSLANIHTVRKSFQAVRTLCSTVGDQPGWLQGVETTKWLHHMSSLIKAAVTVVMAIDKEWRPVLVHCSDGWDRTPQITALSQLLLDPYYRTIEGFRVLVEREWLEFGHKFADRCGTGKCSEDTNERCPVFVQFLDCVHQLLTMYPLAFQFNEAFLVKLAHHTYSNLYGTFLCNNVHDRLVAKVPEQTSSVWTLLSSRAKQFMNPLYIPTDQVLVPSWYVKELQLWRKVYMHKTSPSAAFEDSETSKEIQDAATANDTSDKEVTIPKTRSCENLVAIGDHTLTSSGRRLSDPNIKVNSNGLMGGAFPMDMEPAMSKTEKREVDGLSNLEESVEGIVINNDCVKFCQKNGSSDTLVAVNENSTVASRTTESSATIGNSISNGDVRDDDRMEEVNEKATMTTETTIPSREDSCVEEDCDRKSAISAPCSNLTSEDHSDDHSIPSQQQLAATCEDVRNGAEEKNNSIKVKTGQVVLRQPGSAVFNHDSAEGMSVSINKGSISDSAAARRMAGTAPAEVSPNSRAAVSDTQVVGKAPSHATTATNPSLNCKSASSSEDESRDSFPNQLSPPTTKIGGQPKKIGLMQVKAANMSTSTSDISDSHVHIDFKSKLTGKPLASSAGVKVDETLLGLDMSTVTLEKRKQHLHVDLGLCTNGAMNAVYNGGGGGTSLPGSADGSRDSRHASTAASSTGSPSPASEKSLWGCTKPQNGVNRYLDVDGLHIFEDPVQSRMMQIITTYQEQVRLLEGKLQTAKSLLYHYTSGKNGAAAAGKPLVEDSFSGDEDLEHCSLGGRSANSDASYELVGEDEALMTLWVPDHAVTHCTGCDVEFWIVRRRHHCRNCGKVFCGSCAPYYTPVPQQQLTDPVRVCRCCYGKVTPNIPVESASPDKEAQLGSAMEEEIGASCPATD